MAGLLTCGKRESTPALAARDKDKTKKDNFFSGFLILTLSTVIVKIIGLVYKIPMLGLLGSEGMGYFNSAYEIYALFCIISTSGLPVAMSVMISSGRASAKRVLKVALMIFTVLGALGSAAMLAFARPFAQFINSDKAWWCMVAIAPTVLFVCICSAYRGYFQGLGRMTETAISQLIEALGKLVLGLLFAGIAVSMGCDVPRVAAAGVIGLTLGSLVSALYLIMSSVLGRSKHTALYFEFEPSRSRLAIELVRAAIPITLSSAVLSVTRIVDMSMILRRLQSIGYSSEEAFSMYGSYTTLAVPLFALAPALISAVALPLIPSLAGAIAQKDREAEQSTVADALKLASLISMPMGIGMALFSREILGLVFAGETEAIDTAAPLLTVLGLSVTLSCFITVGNAILNAYGRVGIPIWSMAAGALIKIALAYMLIGNREVNLLGAPISTFACDLTINAVNFYYICKLLPKRLKITEILLRPFASALCAVCLGRLAYMQVIRYINDTASMLCAIAISALAYAALCLVFRAVDKRDLGRILWYVN